jgi:hypothetical protein
MYSKTRKTGFLVHQKPTGCNSKKSDLRNSENSKIEGK